MPLPTETPRRELIALMLLTFVTGLVDAVSFLRLGHVFTANMTGNVVFLGFALAGAADLSATRSIASVAAFLCGAVAGGRWSATVSRDARGKWLGVAAATEATLILLAATVSLGHDANTVPATVAWSVIVITALAMGLRNATVRSMAVPDMTTTVLTLTLTGLAADSAFAAGTSPRTGRRIASVLLMFAGACAGTLLLRWGLPVTLTASAAVTAAAAGIALSAPKSI